MTTMTRDRGHSNEWFIYRFAYIFIYRNFIYQVGQYMQPIYMHFLFLFFFLIGFFLWSFFYSFQFVTYMVTNWNMYTIHNHSTTIYIYIFNLIVHASYFEAFFIIGLRLNSILFTPSCRTKCIQPKLFFFSSKCLFSLYFHRHHRLTHTRL